MESRNSPRATPEEHASNIKVLNKGVSLFGILMGVWWGTLTRAIFSTTIEQSPAFPGFSLLSLECVYTIASGAFGAVVVFFFVRWLWMVADISLKMELNDYFDLSKTILGYVFVVTPITLLYGIVAAHAFGVSWALGAGGGIIHLSWLITSLVLVHWKLMHENEERRPREWTD